MPTLRELRNKRYQVISLNQQVKEILTATSDLKYTYILLGEKDTKNSISCTAKATIEQTIDDFTVKFEPTVDDAIIANIQRQLVAFKTSDYTQKTQSVNKIASGFLPDAADYQKHEMIIEVCKLHQNFPELAALFLELAVHFGIDLNAKSCYGANTLQKVNTAFPDETRLFLKGFIEKSTKYYVDDADLKAFTSRFKV